MNNYPKWWDRTVTIYNKYVNPETQQVRWYRTVVEGCFWKYENNRYRIGSSYNSTVILESKDIICRIPKNDLFVDKREWREMSDEQRNNYFTLGTNDIIVLGEVDDVIDEYTSGSRSNDVLTKYKELQGCLQIETYIVNTGTGVGIEHYRVNGV